MVGRKCGGRSDSAPWVRSRQPVPPGGNANPGRSAATIQQGLTETEPTAQLAGDGAQSVRSSSVTSRKYRSREVFSADISVT